MKFKIIVFFLFSFSVFAQDASSVVKNLQDKFLVTKTLKADFSQTIYSIQSEKSIQFNGKFYFKKENSFSIILPDRDIISDGISIWNYDKKQNKVVVSNVENENTTFSLNEIIFEYPKKCDLLLIDKTSNNFVLKCLPRNLSYSFKEAYLNISKDYQLTKIEIIDFNNLKYVFQLFAVEINQNIDLSKFKFNPKNQVEIIDLR